MKRALLLLLSLVLVCTGCSLDVESYLQPPRVGGQQQAVQAALETYLRDVGGNNLRYTLEYPLEGAHTAAFILCDEKGYQIYRKANDGNKIWSFVKHTAFNARLRKHQNEHKKRRQQKLQILAEQKS